MPPKFESGTVAEPAAVSTAGPAGSPFALLARAERAGLTESWHYGAAAVVTPEGRLVAAVGEPERAATFLRSAAKPFQAMPLLAACRLHAREAEALSLTDPDLSDGDLALICASHSGTDAHVARARSLLERGGFTPADLRCGSHPPLGPEAARRLAERGESPTPLHNNCSGKHAGMLLACRLRGDVAGGGSAEGWPTETYLEPDHPLQRRAVAYLARAARIPSNRMGESADREIGVAVDGCGVPTYRLTVAAAARAYALLAAPDLAAPHLPPHPPWGESSPEPGLGSDSAGLASLAERVARAMTAAPEEVAGPGRFTTRLMRVTGGRLLAKEGYEGFYGVAVRGPVALGMALKIADGGERCRDAVVLEILRRLGLLSGAELEELEDLARPERRNHAGRVVGVLTPDVDLREPPSGETMP